jgi:signal transduction histidine kinase
VRRAALTGVAIAAFIAGITAAAAAAEGLAIAGVSTENPGGLVLAVAPTGFAWRDGIRVGQRVVALDDTYAPMGWRLETIDAQGSHVSREQPFDDALRASLPLGVVAAVVGGLAIVFVRTHRRWVAAFAAVALAVASMPLQIQGNPTISTGVLVAATVLPLGWIASRLQRQSYVAMATAAAAIFILRWASSRLDGDADLDILEPVRAGIATYGTALFAIATIVGPLVRGEGIGLVRPRMVDLVIVAVGGAAATALIFLLHASPLVVLVGASLIVLAVPAIRGLVARRFEHALLADVRAHVLLEASEAERARLARELHDVPLQHLTSVIRHLEAKPDAAEETEQLREIAAELRQTATGLRPPVLDDLGLGAALEFLAMESTSPDLRVTADISDRSSSSSPARPPSDVEMAIFRVAQEAVNNAIQHAGAHTISIQGDVSATAIQLVVRDDGDGLSNDRQREATWAGRLGLASMRSRAEAIDADLRIGHGGPGTSVAVRWQQ